MAGPPKKSLPEVATQIATTFPQGGAVPPGGGQGNPADRRTAALPPSAQVPTAAPHAQTMMFDPNAQGTALPSGRIAAHTVMTNPGQAHGGQAHPGQRYAADPLPAPTPSTLGRWIAGPILAGVVGVLTLWLAGLVTAPVAKSRGKLRLSSDPEGATVVVDGKLLSQPTPTVIDGEIGATLRVAFRLDGFLEKEADVFVGEGERPFRAKLERRDQPPVVSPLPTPEPDPPAPPPSLAPPVVAERVNRPKKEREPKRERVVQTSIAPSMSGTGTVSVHVRPWAIVYVDGAKIRQTPLDGHSLTAGLHIVELVNDGIKKREKITVEVKADRNEEIRRDWEK